MFDIQSVTAQEFAFGLAEPSRLMPRTVPAVLKQPTNEWHQLAREMLESGLGEDYALRPRSTAIDPVLALRHIGALFQSACDDETLVNAAATLLYGWFKGMRVGSHTAGMMEA